MAEQPKGPRELTEDEVKDLESRVKGFNGKLLPLLKEFQLGLGASAFLLPDGRIGARPQMFDDKKYDEGSTPVEVPAAPAPVGELATSE